MRLVSFDYIKTVDVGTGSIWWSIYSTANTIFSDDAKEKVSDAMNFLKTGECSARQSAVVSDQLQMIQKTFSVLSPEIAVFDLERPHVAPPWKGNVAPTVTTLANLYTTADGKNLLTEVIALLQYASEQEVSISVG